MNGVRVDVVLPESGIGQDLLVDPTGHVHEGHRLSQAARLLGDLQLDLDLLVGDVIAGKI